VRLHLLGDATWDGHPIPGERTIALLRALADAGHRGLSDRSLIEELWPDEEPANPTKALQVVVSRARSATSAEAIERTERGYRLGLPVEEVDIWAVRPVGLDLAAQGKYAEALPFLEQAGNDDDVVIALLRSVASAQGVPAALERYESYRERLAELLGVDPSPEIQALHQELLARDRPVRAGVRYDADELVGRDADIAALASLVRGHRLVSIVGAGGLGKTRLAHLVGRMAEQPVVHFVELVSVTSAEGVAVTVADELGARESVASRRPSSVTGRGDSVARIVEQIGSAPALLILDNCEQVVSAVADLVAALLARTPHVTVLTTTRVPLGLAAERVYLLPELSLGDAASLFVERATSARPTVVLDPDRVLSLVARLDGLPLAVELAAAKVRSMSVEEIERRLENRFELLRGGSRDAPERHQTLLAVIDWSWNLLTEEQRVALRRVSVFRDGFAIDGASAVVGGDATDVVAGLVEQSLVVVDEVDGADGLRYRLLETVREFGRMQLVDAGEDQDAALLFRAWAVYLASRASEHLFTPAQVEIMTLIRHEEGNLIEVLRQATADGDSNAVAALLGALTPFWMVEGAHLKILNVATPATDALASGPLEERFHDAARAALAFIVLTTRLFTNVPHPGALARLRELGPGEGPARTRGLITMILALVEGSPTESLGQLLEMTEDPDPDIAQAAALWTSQLYENMGDFANARLQAEQALSLVGDDEGPWSRGLVMAHLSGLELQSGDPARARALAAAAAPIMAELGATEDWAQTQAVVALVAIREGDLDTAEEIFDMISADERVQSVFGGAIGQLCGRAELMLARGQVDEGLAAYVAAIDELRARGIPGLGVPAGLEPWVLFPEAGALAAHLRFDRAGQAADLAEHLREKCVTILTSDDDFIDIPIMGACLFAIACWQLVRGDREAGTWLLLCATIFGCNRMLPSFDEQWAISLADPDALETARGKLEGRSAPDLRPDAAALLERL